ncbi:hypothetical protein [Rhizobium tumorigenes]|uniref:Uncharacterized protein n=1 Tax=Rhizobium tumorigenes TaxID=2041385 RepID=A0AAF1KV82_9HYPH|nr:hypothetical protein [Rhizobium tumorigenes]WFR99295.1 hypothetical protein PR017_27020 [Rhizobium tumorigenes]
MKTEAFQSLIVARSLFEQVEILMLADNKYSSSASLIVLQDAFELIIRAALIQLGVDEDKNLEKLTFDELVAELVKAKIKITKTATLKAMNKGRVTVKHYGQLAEHDTVKNYVNATRAATDLIMENVFQKPLAEVFPGGQINDLRVRALLIEATKSLADGRSFDVLVAVRKAIFLSIERDYDISSFADPKKTGFGLLAFMGRGASAPHFTKNPAYIEENVREPFDYIVFSHEKIKIDLLEWGVNTEDFWNVWRLTPPVYLPEKSNEWFISTIENDLPENLEIEAARYCLDRTINLLQKKQAHIRQSRWRRQKQSLKELAIVKHTPRLRKARADSESAGTATGGQVYAYEVILQGLDSIHYCRLVALYDEKEWFHTYVKLDDCELRVSVQEH